MKTLLRIALEKRGLTISDAARQSGLLYQTIQQHYKGRRSVSAESALRYEQLLGIPREELRPDLWGAEGKMEIESREGA